MAKAFDDEERSRIREALKNCARTVFRDQGVSAANIDQFCKAVGIAKGSFYSFYPSKEELLLALAAEQEEATWVSIRLIVCDQALPLAVRLDGFFSQLLSSLENAPLMTDDDIPYLVRKLGAARLENARQATATTIADLALHWQQMEDVRLNAQSVQGVISLMLGLVRQRNIVTGENYQDAVSVLRKAFLDQAIDKA